MKIEIGMRFGRWLVVAKDAPGIKTRWICRCDCGIERSVASQLLYERRSTSCGCWRRENPNRKLHGKTQTREYRIWSGMHYRCSNPRSRAYKWYGARGISVCPQWKSFETFYRDLGPCPHNHSLDRIDNGQGYSPDNCRWATAVQQARNSRRNRRVLCNGDRVTISEAACIVGLNQKLIARRLREGWSEADALETPVNAHRERK